MSWFSTHYEKALLGTGALIALGAAWFGWSHLNSIEEDFSFSLKGRGNNNAAIDGAERIAKAMQSMDLDHGWKQAEVGGREVDLLTGIPLFIKRSAPNEAVDIVKGEPVHPGIENSFWLDYRLDPGFADSPRRDPDADGFSNAEEYEAKTDPTDRASHPPLIAKLRYIKDESLTWSLRPGFATEDGEFTFKYQDSKGDKNRVAPADMVGKGGSFFATAPMKGRFKVLGHEQREEKNPSTNIVSKTTYVKIEDQKSNKPGRVYEFPAPLSEAKARNFYQHDRSAVLVLEALGMSGKQLLVEENTRFALPETAAQKDYLLKSVTPASIIVEYPDETGQRRTVEIQKGATPRL